MIVNLEREDLINLVKGTSPSYAVMDMDLIKTSGIFSGGHSEGWKWNYKFDENITDEQLYDMYLTCK